VFFQKKKKKVKNQKHPWGPTGTPLGILSYKCGMLLFLSFLGSERCKFEKWPADNAQKMTVQMLDECDLSDLEDVLSEFSVEINKHKIFYANNV